MGYLRSLLAKKWPRRMIILLVLCLIAIPTLVSLDHWANQPNSQSASIKEPAVVRASQPTNKLLKTSYFSTYLPSNYRIENNTSSSDSGSISILAIDSASTNDQQLAIVSDRLPEYGLKGVSSYNLRITDTTDYAPFHEDSLPAGSTAFQTKTGAPSYSVFMVSGGRYVIVTVSDGPSSAMLSLLNSVLNNWVWI
jgi:hypothetical protein